MSDENNTPQDPPELTVLPGGRPSRKLAKTKKKLALRTEQNLTPKMKEIRDRFIAEFLRDFNGPNAYIRAGGPATTAVKMANTFLHEPYVAKRIWEVVELLEEEQIISRKRILAGLVREANYMGIGASHGARVAAYGKLANILGMEQTNVNVKGKIDHTHKGGVMVVPITPGSDAWEQLAEATQKQLKDDVRK